MHGWMELSIVGQPNGIFWEVTHYPQEGRLPFSLSIISEIAEAHYPGAQVKPSQRDHTQTIHRRYKLLGSDYHMWFDDAVTADEIRTRDPLVEVLRVMSRLQPGEEMRYRVSLMGVNQPDQKLIERFLFMSAREVYQPQTGGVYGGNWEQLAASATGNIVSWANQEIRLRGQKILRFSEKETQHYMQKLSQPLVYCFVSVEMDSPDPQRLSNVDNLMGAAEQLTSGAKLRLTSTKAYTSPVMPIESRRDFFFKSPLEYLLAS
jgi:hypothetical protein